MKKVIILLVAVGLNMNVFAGNIQQQSSAQQAQQQQAVKEANRAELAQALMRVVVEGYATAELVVATLGNIGEVTIELAGNSLVAATNGAVQVGQYVIHCSAASAEVLAGIANGTLKAAIEITSGVGEVTWRLALGAAGIADSGARLGLSLVTTSGKVLNFGIHTITNLVRTAINGVLAVGSFVIEGGQTLSANLGSNVDNAWAQHDAKMAEEYARKTGSCICDAGSTVVRVTADVSVRTVLVAGKALSIIGKTIFGVIGGIGNLIVNGPDSAKADRAGMNDATELALSSIDSTGDLAELLFSMPENLYKKLAGETASK